MPDTANKRRFSARDIVLTGMMTALMAACSLISIPSAVPFTLQTFAVFCTVSLIGGKRSLFTIMSYLLIGAAGVPVFSGFTGGIGVILGANGGYLIGFIFTALICWGAEKIPVRNPAIMITSMIISLAAVYIFGTAWFILIYTEKSGAITLSQALKWCVVPFVIPDLVKLFLALAITKRLRKHIAA